MAQDNIRRAEKVEGSSLEPGFKVPSRHGVMRKAPGKSKNNQMLGAILGTSEYGANNLATEPRRSVYMKVLIPKI